MKHASAIGIATLLFSLGCGGLLGYGELVTSQPVQSGEPFSFSYTPKSSEPHQLWFEINLKSTSDYQIKGTVATDQGSSWNVDLSSDGAPITGMRKTYMWSESNMGTTHSAAGSIHGTEIPGASGPVTLTGTLTFEPGTTGTVTLVVTD